MSIVATKQTVWADAEATMGLVVHPACPGCGASSALRDNGPKGGECPSCGVFVAPRQTVHVEGQITGLAGWLLSIGRWLARQAERF